MDNISRVFKVKGGIILEGTLASQGKCIREFYEIENHQQTFAFIESLLEKNESLQLSDVKQIHRLLTDLCTRISITQL